MKKHDVSSGERAAATRAASARGLQSVQKRQKARANVIAEGHQEKYGTLAERLVASITYRCGTGERQRYIWLEARTGISARAWKNMFNNQSQPTLQMVERWCLDAGRDHAAWILLGFKLPEDIPTDWRSGKD